MRTVSFSNPSVQQTLADQFVSTYTNTVGTDNTGMSFSHSPDEPPGPCGRGAGRQNVQTLFLTPQGNIFHVATGFLSPEDLQGELRFAAKTYESLRGSGNSAKPQQTLVSLQSNRMRQLGFSPSEIQYDNPFQQMSTGFSPSDLGMDMGSSRLFGDVGRNRVLRDTKFVLRNPLMDRDSFEDDPTALVGNHKSFFGSNSAMNRFNQSQFSPNSLRSRRSIPMRSRARDATSRGNGNSLDSIREVPMSSMINSFRL